MTVGLSLLMSSCQPKKNPDVSSSGSSSQPQGSYELANLVKPKIADSSVAASDSAYILYTISASDYDIDSTGEEDSTEKLQKALNAAYAVGGGIVFLPSGFYRFDGNLTIPQGVTLRGEWCVPEKGSPQGTVLMVYGDKGKEDAAAFISMSNGSCVHDISFWYPEQSYEAPVKYPFTIDNVLSLYNATFYNSYNGIRNIIAHGNTQISNVYGTFLNIGVTEDKAYDIPRYQHLVFDTCFWADSGLSNSPDTDQKLDVLNAYTRTHTTGILAYREDWGRYYDIDLRNMQYGFHLKYGNISIGKLYTNHVNKGIYVEEIIYPGLMISYSDINANIGDNPIAIDYASPVEWPVSVLATHFGEGAQYHIYMHGYEKNAILVSDCSFEGWGEQAIRAEKGSVNISNCNFKENKNAVYLNEQVRSATLVGNTFANKQNAISGKADAHVTRDDSTTLLAAPDYQYTFAPTKRPATKSVFNVMDFGAKADETSDNTEAFQQALDKAKESGGGTVFVPGGHYRFDGSITIPTGVELRGVADGIHAGTVNAVKGTTLYVYGGKGEEDAAAAFITLEDDAGIRGFSIFYPDQGYSLSGEKPIVSYPWSVRGNKGAYAINITPINSYKAFDFMTNDCTGFVLADILGNAINTDLQVGHGTSSGWVQNFHFNVANWCQSNFPNAPKEGTKEGIDYWNYRTANTFSGIVYSVNFDGSTDALVAESGDSEITFIGSTAVCNQQGGGTNIITKPGFTGHIVYMGCNIFASESKIANVEAGTVTIKNFYAVTCYNARCKAGGTLNLHGIMFVSDGNTNDETLDAVFEAGSKGSVVGCTDNNNALFVLDMTEGDILIANNQQP